MYAIIPAAGQGLRFGGPISKQFQSLKGRPLLLYTLEVFEQTTEVEGVCVVVPAPEVKSTSELLKKSGLKKIRRVVSGGATRQDSVRLGFDEIPHCDFVAIHDGVRPLVSVELILRTLQGAQQSGAAICALPVKETIKRVDEQKRVLETVDHRSLWSIQTPQIFRYELFQQAFKQAVQENFYGTDEAMLVERLGVPVSVVEGDPMNLKVTTPEDWVVAERYLERR